MLMTLHEAAATGKLGRPSEIRANPKRMGTAWWERVRKRELMLKQGIKLDPSDPISDFPSVRVGRVWKIDSEALEQWRKRRLHVA